MRAPQRPPQHLPIRGVHACVGVVLSAAAVLLAGGCGDEDRPVSGRLDPEHVAEVARNPYALTCGDVERQSRRGTRLVIRAQAALTREPALRARVADLGFQRVNQSIYFALTEVCKGHDPPFRPARLAAEGVRRGKYLASLCLGPGARRRCAGLRRGWVMTKGWFGSSPPTSAAPGPGRWPFGLTRPRSA
jgi:hypothetical protein